MKETGVPNQMRVIFFFLFSPVRMSMQISEYNFSFVGAVMNSIVSSRYSVSVIIQHRKTRSGSIPFLQCAHACHIYQCGF